MKDAVSLICSANWNHGRIKNNMPLKLFHPQSNKNTPKMNIVCLGRVILVFLVWFPFFLYIFFFIRVSCLHVNSKEGVNLKRWNRVKVLPDRQHWGHTSPNSLVNPSSSSERVVAPHAFSSSWSKRPPLAHVHRGPWRQRQTTLEPWRRTMMIISTHDPIRNQTISKVPC